MIHINGKNAPEAEGSVMADYLMRSGINPDTVAVEFNGEILPKERYSDCIISDGSEIEIVTFMGGGAYSEEDGADDKLIIGDHEFTSRFILGSGKYDVELIRAAVEQAGAEIITLSVRRANSASDAAIIGKIPEGITLLPNTSGARNADEAVRIARLARELGCGDLIKVEVIRDSKYLLPDNAETVRATRMLSEEGFTVMPYMYPDLNTSRDLESAGAACIMPLAAPIGSNKGLCTRDFIQILIDETDLPVIVDAGIGRPSQACEAMEMGAAAVMANTAIATAGNIPAMAGAFKKAIEAGRAAYLAGTGRVLSKGGETSSPLTGFLYE